MAGQEYTVDAQLRMRAGNAAAVLGGISGRLSSIGTSIRGTSSLFGGLARTVIGLGAGYVGINALASGFRTLIGRAAELRGEVESTRIGLASVLGAASGRGFADGAREAGAVYGQLRDDAIRSVATTRELFTIFQSIAGPLRGAGTEMSGIREITNGTVAAASALGVDFEQAARDIGMMATGTAGVDVKLFRMLRSTGAIAENAQAFNRLSAPERISRLRGALSQFAEAAEAYGRSWAGVTSTFKDVVEQAIGGFSGPIFNRIKTFLSTINEKLIANRDRIARVLGVAGEAAGHAIGMWLDRALGAIEYVAQNWNEIVGRVTRMVTQVRAMVPMLLKAAKAWAAISVARSVVGGGLQAAGSAAGIAQTVAQVLPGLFGGAAAAGGGAAAAAGGTGAAAAGAAAAATEGAAATATASLGGIAVALGYVALLAAPIAGAVMLVVDNLGTFREILGFVIGPVGELWAELENIGKTLWPVIKMLLKLMAVVAFALPFSALIVVVGALRVAIFLLSGICSAAAAAVHGIISAIEGFLHIRLPGWIGGSGDGSATVTVGGPGGATGRARGAYEAIPIRVEAFEPARTPTERRTPQERRGGGGIDARGSRFEINQQFREADPDNVLVQMTDALTREVEFRTQSGYANPLTR